MKVLNVINNTKGRTLYWWRAFYPTEKWKYFLFAGWLEYVSCRSKAANQLTGSREEVWRTRLPFEIWTGKQKEFLRSKIEHEVSDFLGTRQYWEWNPFPPILKGNLLYNTESQQRLNLLLKETLMRRVPKEVDWGRNFLELHRMTSLNYFQYILVCSIIPPSLLEWSQKGVGKVKRSSRIGWQHSIYMSKWLHLEPYNTLAFILVNVDKGLLLQNHHLLLEKSDVLW